MLIIGLHQPVPLHRDRMVASMCRLFKSRCCSEQQEPLVSLHGTTRSPLRWKVYNIIHLIYCACVGMKSSKDMVTGLVVCASYNVARPVDVGLECRVWRASIDRWKGARAAVFRSGPTADVARSFSTMHLAFSTVPIPSISSNRGRLIVYTSMQSKPTAARRYTVFLGKSQKDTKIEHICVSLFLVYVSYQDRKTRTSTNCHFFWFLRVQDMCMLERNT